MTPDFALVHTLPAALSLVPASWDTPAARAFLLAVALQESEFKHRRQINGPAVGYWQFELKGGVVGVLEHAATTAYAARVCYALGYTPRPSVVYDALADNDVLACAFARLLIRTLPAALPGRADEVEGWRQYLAAWNPGKPHQETWPANWQRAWALEEPTDTGDDRMISPTAHQVVVDQLATARAELEKEQAWHAETRVTIIATMEAATAHMDGLRAGVAALQKDVETGTLIMNKLSASLTAATDKIERMQADLDRRNAALAQKP